MVQALSWNIYSCSAGQKVTVLVEPEDSLFYLEMPFNEPCSEPIESALYHHHVSQVASFPTIFKITIHATPLPLMSSSLINQPDLWIIVLLEKLIVAQLFSKYPTFFMEAKSLLLYSQKPTKALCNNIL
jgi:hypothetical protein